MATIGHELGKMEHELTPDLPEGFQMTELGPLPKEWRVVRLGKVAEVIMGQSPPSQADRALDEVLTRLGLPPTGDS